MKCALLLDQYADTDTIREEDRPKLKFWFEEKIHPTKGKIQIPIPYFPKGTIFEHDVIGFIIRGQAVPADDEAAAACGLNPDELRKRQNAYRRLVAGINPDDYELFDAGVIVGYEPETGDYRPGPNWESYMKAREEAAKKSTAKETEI